MTHIELKQRLDNKGLKTFKLMDYAFCFGLSQKKAEDDINKLILDGYIKVYDYSGIKSFSICTSHEHIMDNVRNNINIFKKNIGHYTYLLQKSKQRLNELDNTKR